VAEPFTAYLLAFVTGGLVIYVELATQYSRTQKFALGNFVAFSYFVLHAVLSAILFHIIVSVQDLDLVGKFLVNEPHLKAFMAGLEWQALLRLRIFTFRTPEGKDLPIGVEFFWEKVAKLFEKKLEEKEETKLFEFLQPYTKKYQDLKQTKDIALNYLDLPNLDVGEKATMRKRFEDARTCEEVMYTFIRFRGLTVFAQRFPLS
jgi:hypothetical protein